MTHLLLLTIFSDVTDSCFFFFFVFVFFFFAFFSSGLPFCEAGTLWIVKLCSPVAASIISPSFLGQIWESKLEDDYMWRLEVDIYQYIVLHITDFDIGCETTTEFKIQDSSSNIYPWTCNKNRPVYPIVSKLPFLYVIFKFELRSQPILLEGFKGNYTVESKQQNISRLAISVKTGKS